MAEMKIAITADTTEFERKLRIVARHLIALADELGIDLQPSPLLDAARSEPEPVRQEINNTSASTERRASYTRTAPASPFGFTAGASRTRHAPPAPRDGAPPAPPPTTPPTSAS